MKSIFDKEGNEEIVARIEKLDSESQAKWGKMNVSQMLMHCQKPIEVGTGKLAIKRTFIGFLFGKMVLKQLSEKPFKQNLPTDKHFVINSAVEFENTKKQLITYVRNFAEKGDSAIVVKKHPFFGMMTTQQWDVLLWRHLDHHLTQFGV